MTARPMARQADRPDRQGTYLRVNGIRLHVVQEGPKEGHPVILLHGFPEFWYGWRHQIRPLAAAGFRVLAPDQRGYNRSEKPPGTASYTRDRLAEDVVGLLDTAGLERASVVGHDWGAAVAWHLAAAHPDRVARLVIINVPHPGVFQQHLRSSLGQLLKSWYIAFFQIPALPEWFSRLGSWRLLAGALTATSRPGTFSEEDLARYREAWSQPGACTAMLNWYRAAVREPVGNTSEARITAPTLVIWGARDQFLDQAMARPSAEAVDDGRLKIFPKATHWVHHEEVDRVNQLLLDFLGEG